MITFIFTAARARGGVHGIGVDVARSNHHSGLASALLLPRSSLVLVIAFVLALVVTPRPVLAICLRLLLVAVLVLDLLQAVGDEVSQLAAPEACLVFLLMFTRFSCSLSNRLVGNASSSSPSTSNSSSGIDIREDKENILVDGLALVFPFEPPMRVRL
jgi:hypothetical protein